MTVVKHGSVHYSFMIFGKMFQILVVGSDDSECSFLVETFKYGFEPSVEIEERMAVQFIHCQVDKDAWLEEHYPKQMEIYHNAIEQTKEQILQQYNI